MYKNISRHLTRIQGGEHYEKDFELAGLIVGQQGWIFLRIPRFFNGKKFPSFRWFGEEFPICFCTKLINSGENSLKANTLLYLSKIQNFWKLKVKTGKSLPWFCKIFTTEFVYIIWSFFEFHSLRSASHLCMLEGFAHSSIDTAEFCSVNVSATPTPSLWREIYQKWAKKLLKIKHLMIFMQLRLICNVTFHSLLAKIASFPSSLCK